MAANKTPAIKITGIRGSIPSGYLLGRTSLGHGDVELISAAKAQSVGLIPTTLPGPPTGTAGGDLTGSYPSPTVAQLQGVPVQAGTPSNLAVLLYHTAGATWLPVVLAAVAYSGAYSDLTGVPSIHNIPIGGTTGQVLTKNSNTDYDVAWVTPTGGGSSGAPASVLDDGTNFYLAMQDGTGQLVLDPSGDPVYALEVLPVAAIPDLSATYAANSLRASSTVFGLAKVDNSTITAAAGVLTAVAALPAAYGFLSTLSAGQAVTDSVYTPVVFDSRLFNTAGADYSVSTGRFTPSRSGVYLIVGTLIGTNGGNVKRIAVAMNKNGTFGSGTVLALGYGVQQTPSDLTLTTNGVCFSIVSMNGTTDWVEMDGLVQSVPGSGSSIAGSSIYSFFGAVRLGS